MKNKIWMIGARWRKFPPTLKMIGYNEYDSNKYKLPIQLEYVPSCCYLISRNVIDKISYFDEGYFFYFDDWDYSLRVRNAGFSIWLNPAAIAWHKVSISTQKQLKPYIWWKQMGYSYSKVIIINNSADMTIRYLTHCPRDISDSSSRVLSKLPDQSICYSVSLAELVLLSKMYIS